MRRYEPNSENDILHPSPPHVIISFLYLFIFFFLFADLRTIATAKPTGRECFSFFFFLLKLIRLLARLQWPRGAFNFSFSLSFFPFTFAIVFFFFVVCVHSSFGWKVKVAKKEKKKNTSANWELHDDDTTKNLKNNARGRIHNERFGLCVVEREGGILRRFQ